MFHVTMQNLWMDRYVFQMDRNYIKYIWYVHQANNPTVICINGFIVKYKLLYIIQL